jgi:hypothetical protein
MATLPEAPTDEGSSSDASGEGFAFVMNLKCLNGFDQFEIAPGHMLRRATPSEQDVLTGLIDRHSARPWSLHWWTSDWSQEGGRVVPLERADWRYFVIAFQGSNETMVRIEDACLLAPAELEIGFTVLTTPFKGATVMHHTVSADAPRNGP